MTFEQTLEESGRYLRKNIPGREACQGKGPEVGWGWHIIQFLVSKGTEYYPFIVGKLDIDKEKYNNC